MKVTSTGQPSIGKIGTDKVDSAKSAKSESAAASQKSSVLDATGKLGGPAKVSLSERAQQMQKAKEIASDQSIDEAKVARLQKMIDEGTYKTDAAAIADRMVDEHLLMND